MPTTGDARFPNTSWTLIERIKSPDDRTAATALDELCARYHYPLYCYLRRRGCAHHDAQDVLHDFLAVIFRQRTLARLEETRGRLRGYLALSLDRHLQRWQQREARRTALVADFDFALDFEAIEARYRRERFQEADTPDHVFERKWAHELLRQTIEHLRSAYEQRGKSVLFTALRPALEAGGSLRGEDTPALAERLGMSADAVRTAMTRLLRDFRDALQTQVRLTVEDPREVPEEIAHLMSLFRR